MSGYVALSPRSNRGWPWPDDSWGLAPMFGEGGWCRACGTPQQPQSGDLVVRGGIKPVGFWMPNWRFDVFCLGEDLANEVRRRFDVELRPVQRPKNGRHAAWQIVIPTVGEAWYDPGVIYATLLKTRPDAPYLGQRCDACSVWRWIPVLDPPALHQEPPLGDAVIAASPEWFGDGCRSFRQVVARRELAEFIAKIRPREVLIEELAERR